jgi:hypothetical protein
MYEANRINQTKVSILYFDIETANEIDLNKL